jgi:hypothetical protein
MSLAFAVFLSAASFAASASTLLVARDTEA